MSSRFLTALAMSLALLSSFPVSAAQAGSGVPFKSYHMKAFGNNPQCIACHETAVPTSRPDSKKCIACHGTMDKIATVPNKFDKLPHASPHYGNGIECTVCHKEHQKSRAVCNDCHVVKWSDKFQ